MKPRKQGANELRMALLKETDPSSRFFIDYSLLHLNIYSFSITKKEMFVFLDGVVNI